MLGGFLVWSLHFAGVYGLSSLADVVARADDFGWRMIGAGFTGVCVLACIGLLAWALAVRRRAAASDLFRHDLAALSAVVGAIAVTWQGAPTLIGH